MSTIPPSDSPQYHKKEIKRVVLVSTAMLSFISFWRAGAIVLCDLASTSYYIGGITEQAIGRAAPWFVLAVMLFSYAVRALYMESCSMYTRGGVYKVVKEAMGGTLAKLSVSALMFDYILTGPISSVSAGQYLAGLINSIFQHTNIPYHVPADVFSMAIATLITIYFWHENIKGVPESSDKALKIMWVTTVMAVILIVWSVYTLWQRGFTLPPFMPEFSEDSLGWLHNFKHHIAPLGLLGVTIAFGHSLLAMSGEESLAQVYREIEAPKLKNLERTGFLIFIYSIMLTSLVCFFAVMIIPDEVRISQYSDNLISGLALYLKGPTPLKLIFQAFVVFVGALILSGAVNTSIVGSNGVLNRIGEDGVLPDSFRKPHLKYGTTYRFINLTVGLQLLTILLCRGNVYVLGEAYAFGVVWSFVFNSLSVLILRYKVKTEREFKVPGNIRLGSVEIPLGLIAIFVILAFTALINLVTKKVATISGSLFTITLFIVFWWSEKRNARLHGAVDHHIDKVNLTHMDRFSAEGCGLSKENRVMIAVRDPNNLSHIENILKKIDTENTDVIVMTAKVVKDGYFGDEPTATKDEEILLTKIIALAEKIGHTVVPLLVPSNDAFFAMAKAAYDLGAQELVVGKSEKLSPELQMERIAVAWGAVRPREGKKLIIRITWKDSEYREEIS